MGKKIDLVAVLLAVAVVVALVVGVIFPIPTPPDLEAMATGDTNLTNLVLDRPAGDGSGNYLSLDAAELRFDADADTSMESDTDDQIDVRISAADDFQFTADTFTALSGSTLAANTIAETTAGTGVTVDSFVIKDGGATVGTSGTLDVNGVADSVILDTDGDTTISAPTDDQIDIEVSGADDFKITANTFEVLAGSTVLLNGTVLDLDADEDTSITVDTDDQIDIEISGADDFQFTADMFELLSGSSMKLNAGILDLDADDDTSITADTDDQIDIEISGADDFRFTADTFTALSGSTIAADTIAETTSATGVTIDSLLVKDGGFLVGTSGVADLNGEKLELDADADTSITANADDEIDIEIAAADEYSMTATAFYLTANKLVLDADHDTSVTADTDDQIDIEVSGADDFQITANTFTVLDGSSISVVAKNAAGGGANPIDYTATMGIMDGSDELIVLDINITGADHTGSGNTITAIDVALTTADAHATETAIKFDDTDFDIGLDSAINLEHMNIPTVASAAVTYASSGALFTISSGEVWIVHNVLISITVNFDCTGSDCTLEVGDGNDTDGLLALVDAEMQASDTEGTGWAAGWQGQLAATTGAYLVDGDFVYAPAAGDETIDIAIGGTDPAAGVGTVYITYTRIQ